MELNLDTFVMSNSLEKHPVKSENTEYKIKYLNTIEFFVRKYSPGIELSKEMFNNYRYAFNCYDAISLNDTTIKQYAKKTISNKFDFKTFKFFNYRYNLLCDVLAISAFDDKKLARKILDDFMTIYHKRHHLKMEKLFNVLYEEKGNFEKIGSVEYQVSGWKQNKLFLSKPQRRILITANMSAGKSTLSNALIGKVINKTMHDACTSKIHYIYDKAYEDKKIHKWDYNLELNAGYNILMDNDSRNTEDKIFVATYFNLFCERNHRLCIIDTPGVNSTTNRGHSKLTKQTIGTEHFDFLVYVVNAENAGTEDELKYLTFIREHVPKEKIIFVLNKLDQFRKDEDSISESIEDLHGDLYNLGFDRPVICPVSSYAGLLAKKVIFGVELNEDETDDYAILLKKFSKQEFELSKFYKDVSVTDIQAKDINGVELLIKSGLYGLEQILF